MIRATLSKLEAQDSKSTVVLQDNLGAISWTTEIQRLRKVKLIGNIYHFIRDAVDEACISVILVSSAGNKAEALTTFLFTSAFESFKSPVSVFEDDIAATHCEGLS